MTKPTAYHNNSLSEIQQCQIKLELQFFSRKSIKLLSKFLCCAIVLLECISEFQACRVVSPSQRRISSRQHRQLRTPVPEVGMDTSAGGLQHCCTFPSSLMFSKTKDGNWNYAARAAAWCYDLLCCYLLKLQFVADNLHCFTFGLNIVSNGKTAAMRYRPSTSSWMRVEIDFAAERYLLTQQAFSLQIGQSVEQFIGTSNTGFKFKDYCCIIPFRWFQLELVIEEADLGNQISIALLLFFRSKQNWTTKGRLLSRQD